MTPSSELPKPPLIAIVDDDESVRASLEGLLRATGYQARTYGGGGEFLDSEDPAKARCLISDLQMPDMCGVDLHKALCARGLHLPVIFITAYPGARPRVTADLPGVVACLPKPFEAERLLACIEDALQHRHSPFPPTHT